MAWTALVWVKWDRSFKAKKDWEWLKKWRNVKRAWSVMGDWDMCLEVEVKSADELEDFVINKLKKSEWVADTHSTWSKEVWAQQAA